MPRGTRPQLVLLELAAAAALGGLEFRKAWLIAGIAAGAVLVLLAIVPVRQRWLYQVLLSGLGLAARRRRAARLAGLPGLLGEYEVESVPGGSRGGDIGVVRSGTTWCLPLVLGLDGVFNDDPPVPVAALHELLNVEDVPLSSVRLLTLMTPARPPAHAPAGPSAPMAPLVARYCLLTVDTRRAAQAIAARGGSEAAVHQILRRCAVHAQQQLSGAGLSVRRLNPSAVHSLFATWLGPASASAGRRADRPLESWGEIRVAGTWSTVFAVTGDGADLADRVTRLVAAAPTAVAATTLVLRPGASRNGINATMLVRLSSPDTAPHEDAARSLDLLAQAYDLRVQRLAGEQGELLRATTPVGVGERA